jgi:RNA-directed DNA polymerase
VAQAQAYIIEGYRFIVDIDLAKFFDRVNHDRLMAAVYALSRMRGHHHEVGSR